MSESVSPRATGPPQPVDDRVTDWLEAIAGVVGAVAVYGGTAVVALGVVAALVTPTLGATRSSRLRWQERQRAAQAAADAADASSVPRMP